MKRILPFTLVLAVALASCKRKQSYWFSDWDIPIISDSLAVPDILPDSLLIVNNGNYELDLNQSLIEYRLSDFIDIPDTSIRNDFTFALNLNVPPNTSFVNNVEEHELNAGGAQLKKIKIKEGGIVLKVFNPLGTKTFFTIELPGTSKNGTVLSKDFVAPAGTPSQPGVVTSFVDLSGYEINLTGGLGLSSNIIQSKMIVKSDPNGPTINVTTSDVISFEATLSNLKLSYARGYFGNTMETDNYTTNIKLFNNIESGVIDLDAVQLGLKIENGFKVAARFKLNGLSNTNYEGNTVQIAHPILGNWVTINSAVGSLTNLVSSLTNIDFTPGNSNLEQFLENHGGNVQMNYQIQLNPWGNTSGGWDEIFDEHPLTVRMNGNLPLNVGLNNLVLLDTFNMVINQDPNKTHFKSGQFIIESVNAFPMQGNLEMTLLDENYNPIATLPVVGELASSINGVLVNGIRQTKSTLEVDIPESALNQVGKIKYCLMRLRFNTPNAANTGSVQIPIPENAFYKFDIRSKFVLETRF